MGWRSAFVGICVCQLLVVTASPAQQPNDSSLSVGCEEFGHRTLCVSKSQCRWCDRQALCFHSSWESKFRDQCDLEGSAPPQLPPRVVAPIASSPILESESEDDSQPPQFSNNNSKVTTEIISGTVTAPSQPTSPTAVESSKSALQIESAPVALGIDSKLLESETVSVTIVTEDESCMVTLDASRISTDTTGKIRYEFFWKDPISRQSVSIRSIHSSITFEMPMLCQACSTVAGVSVTFQTRLISDQALKATGISRTISLTQCTGAPHTDHVTASGGPLISFPSLSSCSAPSCRLTSATSLLSLAHSRIQSLAVINAYQVSGDLRQMRIEIEEKMCEAMVEEMKKWKDSQKDLEGGEDEAERLGRLGLMADVLLVLTAGQDISGTPILHYMPLSFSHSECISSLLASSLTVSHVVASTSLSTTTAPLTVWNNLDSAVCGVKAAQVVERVGWHTSQMWESVHCASMSHALVQEFRAPDLSDLQSLLQQNVTASTPVTTLPDDIDRAHRLATVTLARLSSVLEDRMKPYVRFNHTIYLPPKGILRELMELSKKSMTKIALATVHVIDCHEFITSCQQPTYWLRELCQLDLTCSPNGVSSVQFSLSESNVLVHRFKSVEGETLEVSMNIESHVEKVPKSDAEQIALNVTVGQPEKAQNVFDIIPNSRKVSQVSVAVRALHGSESDSFLVMSATRDRIGECCQQVSSPVFDVIIGSDLLTKETSFDWVIPGTLLLPLTVDDSAGHIVNCSGRAVADSNWTSLSSVNFDVQNSAECSTKSPLSLAFTRTCESTNITIPDLDFEVSPSPFPSSSSNAEDNKNSTEKAEPRKKMVYNDKLMIFGVVATGAMAGILVCGTFLSTTFSRPLIPKEVFKV
eukprot:c9785_g1_i1.p1 GENE.c9785_g1_i1~~c9785_g1_i1.p1  ORF type:complete len:870 (-),score=257.72 c9785_g1_i1:57-2666(-)